MLLTKASNDDRVSFDSIRKIADTEGHTFQEVALQALIQIISDPQVIGLLSYNINWKDDHKLDPEKASFADFTNVFNRVIPLHQPSVLKTMWKQERFPKTERIGVLYQVITKTPSLRCLHLACKLMDEEAKLNMNILAYELYAKWWEENRETYTKDTVDQLTDSPDK